MKIQVNFEGLKYLAEQARKLGNQDEFITVALEWAEQAQRELDRPSKAEKVKWTVNLYDNHGNLVVSLNSAKGETWYWQNNSREIIRLGSIELIPIKE
jgi:hypothetical protein